MIIDIDKGDLETCQHQLDILEEFDEHGGEY